MAFLVLKGKRIYSNFQIINDFILFHFDSLCDCRPKCNLISQMILIVDLTLIAEQHTIVSHYYSSDNTRMTTTKMFFLI